MSKKNRRKIMIDSEGAAEEKLNSAETSEEVKEDEKNSGDASGDTEAKASEGASEKEKPEEKKDPKDEKIAELTERLQRLMAEFDNYRKRTEKEKLAQYDLGVSGTVAKLLPMVDSFDRGLASVKDSDPESPVVAGMDLIYKQLQKGKNLT